MRPLFTQERVPALRRRNLLDDAIEGARRGSIGPRSWYNAIPEQPGEREAASEADAEATAVPRPGPTPATPDAAESDRPRYTVHPGRQGKHQPGHNNHEPERGRSDMAPDVDPQELVDRFAHRGQSANGRRPGTPGAHERFDAGDQIIGTHRDQAGRSAPTTRGIIRYGSDGSVHVRPSESRGWTRGGGR
jgi:filamentous hemagglutinin